jgi:hypothetical protein
MLSVWIFVAQGSNLPSGAFETQSLAEQWIERHSLSGLLTEYPLNVGVYDWAIGKALFDPKYPSQRDPKFIGRFSSAYLNHFHYEDGREASKD